MDDRDYPVNYVAVPSKAWIGETFPPSNIRCVSNGLSEREKGFFAKEYKTSLDKKERKKLEQGSRKTEMIKEDKEKASSFVQL
jgi:hypothetical protein